MCPKGYYPDGISYLIGKWETIKPLEGLGFLGIGDIFEGEIEAKVILQMMKINGKQRFTHPTTTKS